MRLAGLGLLGAIAAGLAMAALAGRDDNLPPDVVARVGDSVITKAEFDREAERAPQEGGPENIALRNVSYDPPGYSDCIATKAEKPAPVGGEKPSDETLTEECDEEFDRLMPGVMETLIEAEWIRQEANARGIRMSLAEASRELDEYLEREGAAKKREYEEFLKDSGTTREELLADIQLDLLAEGINKEVTQQASKISERETKEQYERSGGRLRQPERRDLSLVLTRTKAQADNAKAALEGGTRWSEVAKRYSIDSSSRARGGRTSAVTRGEFEDELDQAAFSARRGVIGGPLETQFGWYLFEVTKISEAGPQPAEQAMRTVKRRLRNQREQDALERFDQALSENYRPRTVCAEDFTISVCGNGP